MSGSKAEKERAKTWNENSQPNDNARYISNKWNGIEKKKYIEVIHIVSTVDLRRANNNRPVVRTAPATQNVWREKKTNKTNSKYTIEAYT